MQLSTQFTRFSKVPTGIRRLVYLDPYLRFLLKRMEPGPPHWMLPDGTGSAHMKPCAILYCLVLAVGCYTGPELYLPIV